MWIDPNDPEHFIIGGDAGIFQTWDRGGTYDSMNNMAMGQFYVVSYDYPGALSRLRRPAGQRQRRAA